MDKEELETLIGYLEDGNAISPSEVLRIIAYYKAVIARISVVLVETPAPARQNTTMVLPFSHCN